MPRRMPGFMVEMLGGGPPEPSATRSALEIEADGKKMIDRQELQLQRGVKRLEYMKEAQDLFVTDANVKRYVELQNLIGSAECGIPDPVDTQPLHEMSDECHSPDCPVHGEANKVRA